MPINYLPSPVHRNTWKHNVGWNVMIFLSYGKTSLKHICELWLILCLSGFCSKTVTMETVQAVHFFLEQSRHIQNLQPNIKVNIVIFSFSAKLLKKAEKIENLPKFRRLVKKTNILRVSFIILNNCKLLMQKLKQEVHFTVRNRVPYNKPFTDWALGPSVTTLDLPRPPAEQI